jgi:hypothetical protein
MGDFMNKLRFRMIGLISICAIASISAAEKPVLSPLSATIADARIGIEAQKAQIQDLQVKIEQDLALPSSGKAELNRLAEKTSGHVLQAKVDVNRAAESRRDEKDPNSRANAEAFLGDAARSLNAKPTVKDMQQKYDDESSKAQAQAMQFKKEQDNF